MCLLAAADEWEKYTVDILWDPVEAKRIARKRMKRKAGLRLLRSLSMSGMILANRG